DSPGLALVPKAAVDEQGPGLEAVGLEEVLRRPVTGQHERVDADRALLSGDVHELVHEQFAETDLTNTGDDVEITDDEDQIVIVESSEIAEGVADRGSLG